jgi:hypothetical protein
VLLTENGSIHAGKDRYFFVKENRQYFWRKNGRNRQKIVFITLTPDSTFA